MKIGVSCASGHLGRAVVSELRRFGDYNRPESLAEAYAGLNRLLIISTVDLEPGKRGAQNVAAIDAAMRGGRPPTAASAQDHASLSPSGQRSGLPQVEAVFVLRALNSEYHGRSPLPLPFLTRSQSPCGMIRSPLGWSTTHSVRSRSLGTRRPVSGSFSQRNRFPG
jgi:hypothetical protein